MAEGRFDDAQALGSRAAAMGAKWGFLDDSPPKFTDDLQKARAKAEKAEAGKLLTDARKAYESGRLDDAESMAYRAQRLHGPFGVFDGGERPEKLLGDIQTARAKTKKTGMPPAPVTALAKAETKKPTAPEPVWPDESKRAMNPIMTVAAPAKAVNPARESATKLLVAGRADMAAGRMVEARQKFLDAQKAYPDFRQDEDNPIRCLSECLTGVSKIVKEACRDGGDAKLQQAKTLAMEFGLDCQPIDARLATAKKSAPSDVGAVLLDKARLELKRGQLDVARQLATEAFNGPYTVKNEAAAVMRSIDAEETALKAAAAFKNFEAGVAAFGSQEFAQAHIIFGQIDPACLPADQQAMYHELCTNCRAKLMPAVTPVVATEHAPAPIVPPTPVAIEPAAKPVMPAPEMVTTATIAPPPAAEPVAPPTTLPVVTTAPAAAPVATGASLASQVKALQNIEFQRLREEGQKVQSEAKKLFERGETDPALELLQAFMAKVKSTNLSENDIGLLNRPVDQRYQTLKMLKSQKDFESKVGGRKTKFDTERGRLALAEERKQDQIKDLMKQYNQALKEGKYREAQIAAAKSLELDPDNPTLQAANKIAQISYSQFDHDQGKKNSESMFREGLNKVENPGPYVDSDRPVYVDPVIMKIASDRGRGTDTINLQNKTEAEREIQHKLTMPVDLNFQNTPLRQVISDLNLMTQINIVPEVTALDDEKISLDTPVTISINKVALKSALKLLLNQVHLTYVIADDVLKVTTERKARGRLVQKVYRVAELGDANRGLPVQPASDERCRTRAQPGHRTTAT